MGGKEERRLPAGENSDAERSNDSARNRVESVRGKASGREEGRRGKGWRKFDLSEGGEGGGGEKGDGQGAEIALLSRQIPTTAFSFRFVLLFLVGDLSNSFHSLGCLFLGED